MPFVYAVLTHNAGRLSLVETRFFDKLFMCAEKIIIMEYFCSSSACLLDVFFFLAFLNAHLYPFTHCHVIRNELLTYYAFFGEYGMYSVSTSQLCA